MNALDWRVGWPLYTGMAVAGAAAVVASASTLSGLARTAGWAGWTPWLLPAALDVGGSAGGWCWLRPGASEPARRFGRVVAIVGATATLFGNAAGHLLAAGYLHPGPALVVIVGAVPAAVLIALAHLAALLPSGPEPPVVLAPDRTDEPTDTRATVLNRIRHSPATVADLARATGRSRTTVNGHLEALTHEGAVVRGPAKRYHLTEPEAPKERS